MQLSWMTAEGSYRKHPEDWGHHYGEVSPPGRVFVQGIFSGGLLPGGANFEIIRDELLQV